MLIRTGRCLFSLPPTSRTLLMLISLETVDTVVVELPAVSTCTGISTTLFQFTLFPLRAHLWFISDDRLLNVYVLYFELNDARNDVLLLGTLFVSKNE